MYYDYIQFHNVPSEQVAETYMLWDLEQLFRKSQSSLSKYGFPTPTDIPSEVDEATSLLNNPDEIARQKQILLDLNRLFPNNEEQ